ncbi:MAG: hypothetical protein QOF21_2033, partial [Actinomycetota bacterium]
MKEHGGAVVTRPQQLIELETQRLVVIAATDDFRAQDRYVVVLHGEVEFKMTPLVMQSVDELDALEESLGACREFDALILRLELGAFQLGLELAQARREAIGVGVLSARMIEDLGDFL